MATKWNHKRPSQIHSLKFYVNFHGTRPIPISILVRFRSVLLYFRIGVFSNIYIYDGSMTISGLIKMQKNRFRTVHSISLSHFNFLYIENIVWHKKMVEANRIKNKKMYLYMNEIEKVPSFGLILKLVDIWYQFNSL